MRSQVGSATLVIGFLLAPAIADHAPAASQDFSITNQVDPVDVSRRDLLRQLQAWWDVHGYYPRRASDSNEGGTVKVRLAIRSDGNIATVQVVESSGSQSLDSAAYTAFREGFVRPLSAAAPATSLDLSLHYVLADRRGQPVPANHAVASRKRPFTVTNEPVRSPVVDTMLQRSCTGTVVKQGIRNHPAYGVRNSAEAVFFRRSDGTPWVKFYEGGFGILAPVVEVGKIVKWAGRVEWLGGGSRSFTEYTVWSDTGNSLNGSIGIVYLDAAKASQLLNRGGTVDLSCATEVVPAVTWSASAVTPIPTPKGDPP